LFDVDDDANTTLSRLANTCTCRPASPPSKPAAVQDWRVYRASLLDESARILRDTRYLRDAGPACRVPTEWDVEVTTQEV
jgi:hypothetical protein